jgi:zinc protease
VVVVGDIDPPEALKAVEAAFGSLPAGPEPPKVTAKEPKQYGERRVVVHREAQLPFVMMVYHVPNWQEADAYPLEMLNRILSQGRSSRIYHHLVYQKRLALSAGADYSFDTADATTFTLYAQPLPGKTAAQLEKALEAEIAKLQKELTPERELTKAKNQIQSQFYMSLDSLFFRGMLLGRLETVARWQLIKDFIPKMMQVTGEDVRRVARKYLTPENRTVGVLAPIKTEKTRAERFRLGGTIE